MATLTGSASFARSNTWAEAVEEEEAELELAGSSLQAPQAPAEPAVPAYGDAPPSPVRGGGAPEHYGHRLEAGPPLPDRPPFKAYLGNIPYEIDEPMVEHFFRGLEIRDIIITRHRDTGKPKGVFVEFGSQADLSNALSLHGADMLRRPVRIEVAEPPRGGGGGPRGGGGFRRGGGAGYEEPGSYRERGPPGGYSRYDDDAGPARWAAPRDAQPPEPHAPPSPRERPRLQLKPRGAGEGAEGGGGGGGAAAAAAGPPPARSNPFGDARPADTAAKLKELEERDRQRWAEEATRRKADKEAERVVSPRQGGGGGGGGNGGGAAARPAGGTAKPAVVTVPRPAGAHRGGAAAPAVAAPPPPPPLEPKPGAKPAEPTAPAAADAPTPATGEEGSATVPEERGAPLTGGRGRGPGRGRGDGPHAGRGRGEGGRGGAAPRGGRAAGGRGGGEHSGGARAGGGGAPGGRGRGSGRGEADWPRAAPDKPAPAPTPAPAAAERGPLPPRLAHVIADEKPVETKLDNPFDLLSLEAD
eukprot:scaffold2.g7434.t1